MYGQRSVLSMERVHDVLKSRWHKLNVENPTKQLIKLNQRNEMLCEVKIHYVQIKYQL